MPHSGDDDRGSDGTTPPNRLRQTVTALRVAFPQRRAIGLRAATAVAIPLLIGWAAGQPGLGAQASFGSLAVLYVPDAPFRYRARVVAGVGAALTVVVFVGVLAGSLGWVAVAVTAAVVAGVASFVCQAVELPPPRELMVVMAALAASAIPGDPAQAASRAALTAAGAAIAWVVSMSPLPAGRHRPETRALAAGLDAVAGYLAAIGGADEITARHQAIGAVRRAAGAVQQGATRSGGRPAAVAAAAERLLEAALHVGVVGTAPDARWVAAVRGAAAAVRGSGPIPAPVDGPEPPAHRILPDAINAMIDSLPPTTGPAADAAGRETAPRVLSRLRAAGGRGSVIGPGAARIGVTVGVGVALGMAFGVAHAYWIGLTACAVLQGSNITATRRRFLQRMLGTLAGVGLVFVLLLPQPPVLAVIVAVAAAQLVVDLVISVNYGLAVAAITVLALLLVHLGDPAADTASLVGARALDTLLGAALAVAARLTLWPRATAARLPQAQSRTLHAVAAVLREHWRPGSDPSREVRLRHRLQSELLDLRAIQTDAVGDTLRAPASDDLRWSVTATVDDLAVLTLALPPDRPAPSPPAAEPVLTAIERLSEAVAAGGPARLAYLPVLDGFPRLTVGLTTLAVTVTDVAQR